MSELRVTLVDAILTLREYGLHHVKCPAVHDCNRLHCDSYHVPQPCECWVESTDVAVECNE